MPLHSKESLRAANIGANLDVIDLKRPKAEITNIAVTAAAAMLVLLMWLVLLLLMLMLV